METLPVYDIPMLVSAINFLLRDELFNDLDEICEHYNLQRSELEQKMKDAGFEYSEELKKFW
ncbi:MAG: DUF4250 domain-containing protein [Bacteroidales bacterium]|nr:DUF4250 domain-containing protein [Bacteroidales bacterium]